MNKLKEKIFAFILKRQANRQVSMPAWKKAKTIAILAQNDNIPHIIQDLQKQGKEVVVFTMPTKKEICWLTDRPKSIIREKLTARKFDILIDLNQSDSLTMQYMAMYIQASFKTGRYLRDGIHDLTINTAAQDKPDYLYQQIMRYIEMFGG